MSCRVIKIAVMIGLIANMPIAGATERLSGYSLNLIAEYHDNIKLEAANKTSLQGYVFSPQFYVESNTERFKSSLKSDFDFSRYDIEGYNSNDQTIEGDLKYLFEHDQLGANLAVKRDSTRTSERLDTGRIGETAIRKESIILGGAWQHALDERSSLQTSLSYRDVSYQSDNYQDFHTSSGSVAWLYRLSELTELRVAFYVSEFQVDDLPTVESSTYGIQLGAETELSELLSLSILGGSAHVETDYGFGGLFATGSDVDTYLLDSSLTYTTERHTLSAGVSSQADPSGDGILIKSDRLRLNHAYLLTERSRLNTALIYLESDSLDDRINDQRDYRYLTLGYSYKLTVDWTVSADYKFEYQKRETAVGDAESHGVIARLQYAPIARSWSRLM